MENTLVRRALVGASVCAFTVVGLGAGTATAGEITGNGNLKGTQGKSECSYSGQNDGYHILAEAQDELDAATRVQSYGQIIRHAGPMGGLPGLYCNPVKSEALPHP